MEKEIQINIIRNELLENGIVDNVSAFKGRYGTPILRLGAIIHVLRHKENFKISTEYANIKGMRNCKYILKK